MTLRRSHRIAMSLVAALTAAAGISALAGSQPATTTVAVAPVETDANLTFVVESDDALEKTESETAEAEAAERDGAELDGAEPATDLEKELADQPPVDEATEFAATSELVESSVAEAIPASSTEDEDDDSGDNEVAPNASALPLTVSIDGLPPLDRDLVYVMWTVTDGGADAIGEFEIGRDDSLIDPVDGGPARFDAIEPSDGLVVTLEPRDENRFSPSTSRILAGPFNEDGVVELSLTNPVALGTDFGNAEGTFILATPTNGLPDSDELAGIWFEFLPDMTPSLTLPTLPVGWEYESWVVIDDRPISLGRFSAVDEADDFDGFSGTLFPGPDVPGEDLLMSPPDDLTFPLSLQGQRTVITVESVLDDDARPFGLSPLEGAIPADAAPFKNLPLTAGDVSISGTVVLG